MNKTLSVKKYAVGKTILHAYDTKDFLADRVFLLDKDKNMIIVQQPSFKQRAAELTEYLCSLNVNVEVTLHSYHMATAKFLPEVPVYATKEGGYH